MVLKEYRLRYYNIFVYLEGGDDLERRGRLKSSNTTENYSSSSYAHTETFWTSWLIPVFVVLNIAVFVVLMYINNCPKETILCLCSILGLSMPSELMDSHGFSPSSFLSEEVQLPNERQIGFWKTDGMPEDYDQLHFARQ
ncbi:hypothetical protein L6452_34872 [Arctium lappa]|uniref:Uncharacterized protein n=1 Tax=Arctium lappa TaxID=4217 RepID=A0ACB8YK50_ARCLA|nr:hypothetical protein L6452_34872 [Arctium lappa]